ncbi:hypothetical protein F5B20DRAFT_84537 [Whalleya microplaca]|nr:hypothetical protein F5B20DRAFT_84537 [Whalleya microplaca]
MMLERASTMNADPFRINASNELYRELMYDAELLDSKLIDGIVENVRPPPKVTIEQPRYSQLPGVPKHAKQRDERVKEAALRFIWAVGASLFLLVPVLIMSLITSLVASLVVTSVSVLLFAFTMCFISADLLPGLKLKDFGVKDIVAITLAYAAVLIVFVGSSVEQQATTGV